jgi:predicted aspartyl protease
MSAVTGLIVRAAALALTVCLCAAGRSLADGAFEAGVKLYNQKAYRAALSHFESCLGADGNQATAVYYQGLCYQQLGDFARAKQIYRAVCRQYGGTPEARMAGAFLKRVDPEFSRQAPSMTDVAVTAETAAKSVRSTPVGDAEWKSLPSEAKIPFRRSTGRHLYVDAEVNGRPMKVIFDTGAEVCLFGSSHLTQAGLTAAPNGPAVTVAGVGGTAQARTTVVTVRVGPIRRTIPVLVQDNLPTPPLLGQTFFQGFQYRIDNQAGFIAFRKRSPSGPDKDTPLDSVAVPFIRAGNNLVVQVEVNGQPYPMFFDTGAASIVMSLIDAKRLNLPIPEDAEVVLSRGVGGAMPGFRINVSRMQLGPVLKTSVPVTVLLVGPAKPLLGQPFFGDRQFTIDNENQVIRFFR